MSDVCHECGRDADPAFVMRFDDIGEPPIHWCDVCGPEAHAMNALLEGKLKEPGFAAKFKEAMDDVVAKDKGVQ